MELTEKELSVMANAIGFVMLQDGRSVDLVDGVEQIHVSDEEAALCLEAAKRAMDHLAGYRSWN